MKAQKEIKNMFSLDLFQPKSRINVFSIESGLWAGYITRTGDNQFQATRMNGTTGTFEDEEGAKWFLRNPKAQAPIIFPEEVIEPIIENQLNLFA